jgi:hypothetical protein
MSRSPCFPPPHLRAGLALLVAACGGGSTSTGPTPATGSLTVTIEGATAGTPSVQVTGPGGFAQTVTTTTTISALTPGAYVVTAADLGDVGLRYVASPRTSNPTVTGGAAAAASIAYALPVSPRSTTDRTDEVTGAQLKMLYVVPSDGVDRGRDTSGVVQRSVSSWQRWLASQSSGRYLRLDTFGGGADIQFVRLPRTDAVYRAFGTFIRDTMEKDLTTLGVTTSTQKLYLAYYDGGHVDRCASAANPPRLAGRLAALYLQGTITGGPNCNTNNFAASPTAAPAYLEFVAAHEVMHLLGFVSAGAPDHGFSGHTITDPNDLMYAGTAPWTPSRFDQPRRNYFNPAGLAAGVGNFATSPYVIAP